MQAMIGPLSAGLSMVLSLFKEIPKEIWAAAVAAGIALLVAVSTNKNARRIIEAQLRDAAQLEESKRQMQLRRDVYLPAVKAFGQIAWTITNQLDVNVTDAAIREANRTAMADIVGIQVVAGSSMLAAVAELNRAAGELNMELTVMRARLMAIKSQVDASVLVETRETQTGTGLVELMRHHNLNGGTPEQWARIQTQWDLHQRALAGFVVKRREEQNALQRLNFEMMDLYKAKMPAVMALQAAAAVELRRELDLPTDEKEFLRLAKEAREAAGAALERATSALQAMASESAVNAK